MKKAISIFLAMFLCLGSLGLTAFADEVISLGDTNGDGFVDNLDASAILKYDAGLTELTESELAGSDVNYDGYVDNADAAAILKYDAGLISKFCEEHIWTEVTSCADTELCTECGLKGKGIPHTWQVATCTSPEICTVCTAIGAPATGHAWVEATCKKAKHCTGCGSTMGYIDKTAHNFENGVCTICGVKALENALSTLRSRIQSEGAPDEYGIYSWLAMYEEGIAMYLEYDPDYNRAITFTVALYLGTDEVYVSMYWTPDYSVAELVALFYTGSELIAYGNGDIDIASFTTTTNKVNNLTYEPDVPEMAAYMEEVLIGGALITVAGLDELLKAENLGITIKDMGFTSFAY